ncbi:MAG: zinc ribbon domain-containing protein [Methanomassiliicoccales archaeon]|nr:zinc ribbon domain-containing protein [Methanomassiliicoccales archaeon]
MSEAKPYETSCPKCGAARVEGQRICPNCGQDLFALEPDQVKAQGPQGPRPPQRHKSIGLTIVLAIIFPGLGHLYAGRWGRGLTIMVGFILVLLAIIGVVTLLGVSVVGLVCVPVLIIGGLLLFIPFELWQIFDAVGSSASVNMGRS